MDSIKVRQRVGEDGILHLEIPIGLAHQEIDVMVVYQPVQTMADTSFSLERLYGICADDPIVLDDQGILETMDDNLAGAFD
ncbi:MAG: hypothetical protein WA885_01445 [Phormidesmis sp.]